MIFYLYPMWLLGFYVVGMIATEKRAEDGPLSKVSIWFYAITLTLFPVGTNEKTPPPPKG